MNKLTLVIVLLLSIIQVSIISGITTNTIKISCSGSGILKSGKCYCYYGFSGDACNTGIYSKIIK